MQSGAAGHPHQQRGAQSILITDAAPRFRNRVPRGAGVRTVLLRALLGVHLGAVARSRSLERPERIPVAAAAPPAARSEYYRGAACGYLALLPAPHPAGLAGPEAPCPRRLGSKHPGAQRRQPRLNSARAENRCAPGVKPSPLISGTPRHSSGGGEVCTRWGSKAGLRCIGFHSAARFCDVLSRSVSLSV